MDRNYFNEYYEMERNHWWFRVREKIIENQIIKISNGNTDLKILNIGTATGRSTEYLSKYGQVTSIEYDKKCCEFLKERLELTVINASIIDLPFSDCEFDIVCAFDVIEHVQEDTIAINEMMRVCKDTGYVYITVPAYMSLWSHHDVINHHFRRYTLNTIKKLFINRQGNKVYSTYFNSLLFIPIYAFRILSKLLPNHWIRKNSESDFSLKFKNNLLDKVLYSIFNLEIKLLKSIKFPFGVSILWLWKK